MSAEAWKGCRFWNVAGLDPALVQLEPGWRSRTGLQVRLVYPGSVLVLPRGELWPQRLWGAPDDQRAKVELWDRYREHCAGRPSDPVDEQAVLAAVAARFRELEEEQAMRWRLFLRGKGDRNRYSTEATHTHPEPFIERDRRPAGKAFWDADNCKLVKAGAR